MQLILLRQLVSKKHGFSLVELMVVVGILGVLVTIAIPNLRDFIARQKQAQAQTYLTQIQVLERIYFADNYTYWPRVPAAALTPLVTNGVSVGFNDLHFYPQEGSEEIYYDLSVRTFNPGGGAALNQFVALAVDRATRSITLSTRRGRDRWIATRDCVCCTRNAVNATSAVVPPAAGAWGTDCNKKCGPLPVGMPLP